LATEAQDKAEERLLAAQAAAAVAEEEYLAQEAQDEKEAAKERWNAALKLERAAWDAKQEAYEDVRRLDSSPQVQRLVKEITKSQVRVRTFVTTCVLLFLGAVVWVVLTSPSQNAGIENPSPSPSQSVIQTPVPTPTTPSPAPSGSLPVDPSLLVP
jgi:ferric-dicitrate binding protein FerR (iron transport regulator)